MRNGTKMTLLAAGLSGFFFLGCGNEPTRSNTTNQGPTPPTDLKARFVNATQIRLDWKDNSHKEEGYDIFEAVGTDSIFLKVSTAPANAVNAFLNGRQSNLKYFYKIRATSSEGYSNFSNIAILEGGSLLAKLKIPEGSMRCAAFSPDGATVATGSGDYKGRIWDWANETEIAPLIYHESAITSLSYSSMGGRLATSDDVQTVIWDTNSGQYHYAFAGTKAVYTPDGIYLVAWIDSVAKLLDPTTFDVEHVLARSGKDFFVSRDSHWLVSGSDTLKKYDITSSADTISPMLEFVRYQDTTRHSPVYIQSKVRAISPDGEYALIGGDYIHISDATLYFKIAGLNGTVFSISPDGRKLVSGANDWKVSIWNLESGTLIKSLSGHLAAIYSVAWSPNGSFVVSAAGDATARVWGPFE